MSQFDAKAARSKRPLPLWVDAFTRDTALLETDEVGAYFKILMAMWSSRDVALPDDHRKLARAAGVSPRLWKARIWPSLEGFFTKCAEGVTQSRLRKEAAYVERQVKSQSDRKTGENSPNALESIDEGQSADDTTDEPRNYPSQQPNNLPLAPPIGGDGQAVDFTKAVFDRGVAFLSKYGTSDRQARTMIGKWRKDAGDDAVFAALRDASREGVTEPVAWITARLKPKPEPFKANFDLSKFEDQA